MTYVTTKTGIFVVLILAVLWATFGRTAQAQEQAPAAPNQTVSQSDPGNHNGYRNVPRDHWAYEVIEILAAYPNPPRENPFKAPPGLLSRYELAVAVARLMDRFSQPSQVHDIPLLDQPASLITRAEVADAIAALRREFTDELTRLGVRDNSDEMLSKRIVKPPRITITPTWGRNTTSYTEKPASQPESPVTDKGS